MMMLFLVDPRPGLGSLSIALQLSEQAQDMKTLTYSCQRRRIWEEQETVEE
jgi:hypothetical protein